VRLNTSEAREGNVQTCTSSARRLPTTARDRWRDPARRPTGANPPARRGLSQEPALACSWLTRPDGSCILLRLIGRVLGKRGEPTCRERRPRGREGGREGADPVRADPDASDGECATSAQTGAPSSWTTNTSAHSATTWTSGVGSARPGRRERAASTRGSWVARSSSRARWRSCRTRRTRPALRRLTLPNITAQPSGPGAGRGGRRRVWPSACEARPRGGQATGAK